MNDDINTKRTELANQMAAAGAAVLDFTGTAAALAAIPDTEPQQYVAAGTPENIAAILPATITPQRRQKHGERPSADSLKWGDSAAEAAQPASTEIGARMPCGTVVANVYDAYNAGRAAELTRPAATSGDAPTDLSYDRLSPGDIDHIGSLCGNFSRLDLRWTFTPAQFQSAAHAIERAEAARIERAAAPAPSGKDEPMPETASLVARPLLYSETVNGEQVRRDDLWIVTTHVVNRAAAELAAAPATTSGDELPPLPFSDPERAIAENWTMTVRDAQNYARAAVSAATKPESELRAAVRQMASALNNGEWANFLFQDDDLAFLDAEISFLVNTRSAAATKPTADLSKVPVVAYTKVVHQGWPEYNRTNEFSDGSSDGAALVKLADVQSLLATKPAAAPEGWKLVPEKLTPTMRFEMSCQCPTHFGTLDAMYEAALAAAPAASTPAAPTGEFNSGLTPEQIRSKMRHYTRAERAAERRRRLAASTTGAAQTAEQVRAIYDAVHSNAAPFKVEYALSQVEEVSVASGLLRDLFDAAGLIERPTPTHSSEAGE